ncbi:MAG: hypothetical protein MK085_03640 [Phycisphaerales bacterium]|nr:hypothetical protein [Phycisphaerales bacterium]
MPLERNQTPFWAILMGRSLLWLVLAGYFSVIYMIARGLIPSFGISPGVMAKTALMTTLMGGFVVWLVLYVELPEMVFGHALPRWRARKKRCHACNHPADRTPSPICHECGAHHADVPPPYVISWKTVHRFGLIFIASLLTGVLVGETWISRDEARIRTLVPQSAPLPILQSSQIEPGAPEFPVLYFHRIWPASFSEISWTSAEGFRCTPVVKTMKFRDT